MMNLENILAKVKEVTASGLPFMEGREKGDLDKLIGETITITDYGFMEQIDKDGVVKEYVAFILKEDDENFFFGGQVLTDSMKKIEDSLTDKEIEKLLENGIPVALGKKKSKNNREYTTCNFFPNQE